MSRLVCIGESGLDDVASLYQGIPRNTVRGPRLVSGFGVGSGVGCSGESEGECAGVQGKGLFFGGFKFRVEGSDSIVQTVRERIWGLRFRVLGLGMGCRVDESF